MYKLVEVKGLQKNFGQFQALKDVSFEVNAGEVLGYIGPNGAGKSATIRILLGIIRATQGKVQILYTFFPFHHKPNQVHFENLLDQQLQALQDEEFLHKYQVQFF